MLHQGGSQVGSQVSQLFLAHLQTCLLEPEGTNTKMIRKTTTQLLLRGTSVLHCIAGRLRGAGIYDFTNLNDNKTLECKEIWPDSYCFNIIVNVLFVNKAGGLIHIYIYIHRERERERSL